MLSPIAFQKNPFQPNLCHMNHLAGAVIRFQARADKESDLLSKTLLTKNGNPSSLISVLRDLEQAIQQNPGPKKNSYGILMRNITLSVKRAVSEAIFLSLMATTDPKQALKLFSEKSEVQRHEGAPTDGFKHGPVYETQFAPYLNKASEAAFFQQYQNMTGSILAIETPLSPVEVAFVGPLAPYVRKSSFSGGWHFTEEGLRVLAKYPKGKLS